MSGIRDLVSALNILNKSDPKVVQALAKDISLEKAAEHAENLEGDEWIKDNWAQGNVDKAPTREEIKVGPREASSGEGAERMIRDYSDTAPQHGITLTAEAMSRLLGPMNSSMKSLAAAMSSNTAILTAMLKAMADDEDGEKEEDMKGMKGKKSRKARKAASVRKGDVDHEDEAEEEDEEEEEEEESEEESEVVEINAAKCRKLLTKARNKIAQAKAMKAEAEEEREEGEDEEKCKAKLRKARALRKAAARLLAKARTAAYAADSAELKKAVRLTITKADINVVQEEEEEEEEEDEEEEEEGEEETKARKAKGSDAKGNQADHEDKESGNQDAEAVKALATKVEKSLEGFAMLQTDVKGLMEAVSGRSKGSTVVPMLTKAQVATADDLNSEIASMVDAGTLNDADAFAARDILSKITATKSGLIDKAIVHDRIAKSSPTVRSIINRVAV